MIKLKIKKGDKGRDKKEYQLYMENKSYYIIYNNKKCYLTMKNIMKRNNKLYMKIDKKYIKIIL